MQPQPITFQTHQTQSGHKLAQATLNAPKSLNAINLEMVKLLLEQLKKWQEDPTIIAVLLDGAGEKAFCAGGDVVSIVDAIKKSQDKTQTPQIAKDFFEQEYRLDYLIHTYKKPIIAWANGYVMGGGMGLMMGASHRIVTPDTKLSMPEITIGLYPDVGASYILSRIKGGIGKFLALTGAWLNASDALKTKLANFALAPQDKEKLIEEIKQTNWTASGDKTKQITQIIEQITKTNQPILPESNLEKHEQTIQKTIAGDNIQEITQRLKELNNSPDKWLKTAGETFTKGSPMSAALGLEMQKRAEHLNLADTFKLEYKASTGACIHPDFAEGVRALLIDKDKNPKWQNDKIDQATIDSISEILTPKFEGLHPLSDLGK